ncbi:tyrosine-type recombinase/integrase [Streptomyces aidingensis]|uniref:Tyr recombinase domain-containing protein n=1 Tax=Streptomyces aidingensis TaxID=910347 RepID=A0A1I1V5G4_9ACTN|nr:site-specific integrase [Streptomyces aidingensis]SFD78129.1 hypothetical protein SAMN05421773_13019 [Streptomyces aidingensis]
MKTTEVRIWGVRKKKGRGGKEAFEVRWSVAGRPISRSRATKGLADKLRSQLIMAVDAGEQFDTVTGLPSSLEEEAPKRTWYEFALDYLRMKWPHASPNYRDEINEGLTAITKAILPKTPERPSDEVLQRALRDWAFLLPGPKDRELPPPERSVLTWIEENSPPLAALADPAVLLGVVHAIALRLDGEAAGAETAKRKRKTLVNALKYATQIGEFEDNPLGRITMPTVLTVRQVDPRVVVNPEQATSLINAVSYVGGYERARGRRLMGLFAGMYYAGLRPAEAVGVAEPDCTLPLQGWGQVVLHRTRPTVGKKWTKTGEAHDDRGLKNRAAQEVRVVPLPPQLVRIWNWSIETFGTADDGRLFFNERGGLVGSSTYYRVWSEARQLALPPDLVKSPLAARPYDLRHAALSSWLNAGVPSTEVAERAGNSVEVLNARYAKCLHGRHVVANRLIENLYGEYE